VVFAGGKQHDGIPPLFVLSISDAAPNALAAYQCLGITQFTAIAN
jgi:hypothetical protein